MIFGAIDHFAVEAGLEPGPEYPAVQGHHIAGRIRVWFSGVSVGNFDEPSCWLDPPRQHLVERLDLLDELWEPSFDGLSPERMFAQLDEANFGVPDRFSSPTSAPIDGRERDLGRFDFLLNSSEAFDGWKAFLLRPLPGALLALVFINRTSELRAFEFSMQAYRDAVGAFNNWLTLQERTLLTR